MRRLATISALAALVLLLPSRLLAQETTGGLAGTVVKASGEAVAGASVHLSSTRGDHEVATDAAGKFLFSFLTPGSYDVRISADGYAELKDEGIAVGLGTRVSRRYVLQPVMQESMTVEAPAEAPQTVISDLHTTTSGANISAELAENIPMGRNISNLAFLAPNVKSGGGTGNANPSIGGSSGFENNYVFDGINVTNAGYGALGSFSGVYKSQGTGINFNFVKETQVITNGFAAEYGQATGGIVNLITKSGSNEWDGSVYGNYTPTGLQAGFRVPDRSLPVGPTLGIEKVDYGFDVGGPLRKDHLFMWVGANPAETTTTRRAPGPQYGLYDRGPLTLKNDTLNYAAKLSLVINPDHRLDLTLFGDPSHTNMSYNAGNSALRQDDDIRFTKLETGYKNWGLTYHGTISPTFLVEATAADSHNTFQETLSSKGNVWQSSDVAAGQLAGTGAPTLGGIGYTEPDSTSDNKQLNVKVTKIIHNHEIKVGAGVEDISYDFVTEYTGAKINTRGPDGIPGTPDDQMTTTGVLYQRRFDCSLLGVASVRETEVVNDPALLARICPNAATRPPLGTAIPIVYRVIRGQVSDPARKTSSDYTFAFLQDNCSITPNLHLSFGVRYEKQGLKGNTLSYNFPATWSPRVGVAWDPTHVGKSKLYGFWGRFYEKVPLDLAVRSLSQEVDLFDVFYDPLLSQEVPQGINGTPNLRYSLTGSGATEIEGGTKNSYTDGMTIGYERDLGRGWSLKSEWQHRKLGDILEDFSNVPASDIIFGTNSFGNYFIGNIPPGTAIDISGGGVGNYSYAKAKRDYQAMTVEGTHRGPRYYFTAQYALSNVRGNYEGLYRNDNDQSDPNITSLFDFPNEALFAESFTNGNLNTDRTHRIQTYGYYSWRNGWMLGGRLVAQSGIPVLKLATHPVDAYGNVGEVPLARRGALGTTPYEYNLDLNFGKTWKLPSKFDSSVRIDVDVFNFMNRTRATTWDFNSDTASNLDICTVDPADPSCATAQMQYDRLVASIDDGPANPDYNVPRTYSPPREVRIGVKWQF
jgi:hypothetical protein